MSREALGVTAPDEPDDGPAATTDDTPPTLLTTISLEDPNDPNDPQAPNTPPPAGLRQRLLGPAGAGPGRLALVAAVLAALVVGALGGATSARQQAQARLDEAAQVVLAITPDQGSGLSIDGTPVDGDVHVLVDVSLAGRVGDDEVRIERLRTPLGTLTLFPPVTTRGGADVTQTQLRGAVDCSRVRALTPGIPIVGTLLAASVAEVRPTGTRLTGTRKTFDLPVLLANPVTMLSAVESRCKEATAEPDPFSGPTYAIEDLTARADGSVTFVVGAGTAFDGGDRPLLTLAQWKEGSASTFAALRPVRTSADTSTFPVPQTDWTLTTTPRLPLTSRRPVNVQIQVSYRCPPGGARRTQVPALPEFPSIIMGTVDRAGQVRYANGWDESRLQTAAVAAAVRSCARAGSLS